MSAVSLTGQDDVIINGRVLRDVGDADWCTLDFDTDIANLKVSKDGNTIYALNSTGRAVKTTLRVLAGSADDKFLNSLLTAMKADFSSFSLLSGSFIKRVGDGAGNISSVVYQLAGGIFKKDIATKGNAEGDVSQSVAVYELLFKNQGRSIQ